MPNYNFVGRTDCHLPNDLVEDLKLPTMPLEACQEKLASTIRRRAQHCSTAQHASQATFPDDYLLLSAENHL